MGAPSTELRVVCGSSSADDLLQTWPGVLAGLDSVVSCAAYGPDGACFPPRELQRAGLDPAGAVISAAELVVRINLVPVVDDECVPNEEELMVAMGCACGLHSDTHDVDRHELIVYLHAQVGGGGGGGSRKVGHLALALRLRGGAAVTRGTKTAKGRTKKNAANK